MHADSGTGCLKTSQVRRADTALDMALPSRIVCHILKDNKTISKPERISHSLLWSTLSDFIFLGSKITADGDCSHEIKRCLFLGRKLLSNLDSIFKSRDIILPTKVRLVKAMVFPVVIYGCESWTVKKAELSTEELMLLNCGVGEDSWESLGLQGDPTSPFWRRSALGFLWKE